MYKQTNIVNGKTSIISPRKVSHLSNRLVKEDYSNQQTKITSTNKIFLQSNYKAPNQHKPYDGRVQRVKSTHSPLTQAVRVGREDSEYSSPTIIKKSKVIIQSPHKETQIYTVQKFSSGIIDGQGRQNSSKIYRNQKQYIPFGIENIQNITSSIRKVSIPTLFTTPQDIYEGDVDEKGDYHGKGVYFFRGCNVKYEGQFYQGQIHGKGKLSFQIPTHTFPIIYQGNFKIAKKNGQGKFYYGDQNHSYTGLWVNDVKQGFGVYQSPDQIYEGNWARNKKHGEGHLIVKKNGTQFKGTFYDDYFTQGTIRYSNEDSYEGSFHLGKKQGYGTYTYHIRNQQYSGQFQNDLRHGKGTLKYSNGDFFTGTFRHGRIDESMNCSYKWVDGSVFNGWFKNNKPDKGTVRNPQQKEYEYTSTASFIIC